MLKQRTRRWRVGVGGWGVWGRGIDIREGGVDTEKQAAVNQGIGQAQNATTD